MAARAEAERVRAESEAEARKRLLDAEGLRCTPMPVNGWTRENLNVLGIDQEALAALALDMPRALNWSVMISEGELFVTDERGQHEIPLQWLAGER